MRRIYLGLAMLLPLSSSAVAQSQATIPPFKYVVVETIDYSGIKDMFQVSLYARRWLTLEQFELIGETPDYWKEEVKKDTCSIVTVKLQTHERISGKYHTTMYLVDCKKDTVYQSDGKAMGSTPAQGFQYAAQAALKGFLKDWEKSQEAKSKKEKD